MRRSFIFSLGLFGLLTLGACSSATDEAPKAQANSATANATSVNSTAAPANTANSNMIVANGMMVPGPQAVDPNAPAEASADPVEMASAPGVSDKMEKLASSVGTADPAKLAAKNAQPAPDNSTFTSYLTDAGYEIRTFKSHPQLLRVEKRLGSNGNATIKVFLRDGKVVDVEPNKIKSVAKDSAGAIAAAAGLTPKPGPPAPGTGSTGAKKS